jgi:hypothetical protein
VSKEGFWISKDTGQYWPVHEHCLFAKSPEGATAMGLPEHVREMIATLSCDYQRNTNDTSTSAMGREQVVIAVLKAGYIRMRGHGAQFSFEFWGDTSKTLWVIYEFCQNMAGPFTWVVINNLKSNEQFAANFEDFAKRMKSDEAEVLRIASQLLKNPGQLKSVGG